MGCNCKSKTVVTSARLADGGPVDIGSDGKLSFLQRLLKFLLQMLFGIVCGAVIIIMTVPLLLYITACLMLGKGISFNPSRVIRKANGRK